MLFIVATESSRETVVASKCREGPQDLDLDLDLDLSALEDILTKSYFLLTSYYQFSTSSRAQQGGVWKECWTSFCSENRHM